jgi:WD40 repeat protein
MVAYGYRIAGTMMPIALPLEHQDVVVSAAFSPDSTRVVTASKDKTAGAGRLRSLQPLAQQHQRRRGGRGDPAVARFAL